MTPVPTFPIVSRGHDPLTVMLSTAALQCSSAGGALCCTVEVLGIEVGDHEEAQTVTKVESRHPSTAPPNSLAQGSPSKWLIGNEASVPEQS